MSSPSRRGWSSLGTLRDLWGFLRTRKKYWLLPVLLALVFLGALIVLASSSAVSPFIYAIF